MRRMTMPALALAMSLVPVAAGAQTPEAPREHRVGAGVERILEQREELGLSVQQVAELRRIQAELQQKNEPLMQQLRDARQQLTAEQREQMRGRRAAADSMRQKLTPEQREQMREQRLNATPEQREQMRERMRSMTPEQREELRQQRQDRRPRPRPGMRGNVPAELQPMLEQIRANTRDAATQIHAALTAEQREKLVELRAARRGPRGR